MNNKLRFEVFKRDGFRCGYCGRTPPTVILQVDHIDPKSAGGSDDINNLLTACFECNSGKTNIPLSVIPKSVSENLILLKEKESQIRAYNDFVQSIKDRENSEIQKIDNIFADTFKGFCLSDKFKNATVRRFLKMLPFHEVEEAMNLACSRKANEHQERCVSYFCGICWHKIKGKK